MIERHALVAGPLIRVDLCIFCRVERDEALERVRVGSLHHACAYPICCAIPCARDNGLADATATQALLLVSVLVLLFAAVVGFIYFDRSRRTADRDPSTPRGDGWARNHADR